MGQICSQMLAVDHFWQSVDVILEDVPVIETIFDAKLSIRRVYHIVAYLQVGVYHIVAYHDRNFIRKWTSGICRVRKLYQI